MGVDPRRVKLGFYSVGADGHAMESSLRTRVAQHPCPRGSYCELGVRRLCPGGTFGASELLRSSRCSGFCAAGHECPPGTRSATQHPCPAGRYASRGQATCAKCPGTPAAKMRCADKKSCCDA